MNVLLVSQCDKRALTETRRILDQFAERRGERVWQTPITEAGLSTLRKLLRKTARKNTAVACHWIRGRDHSELLWIVGDARRFNAQGATPTNTTARDVLRAEDENDWHSLEDIHLLARMAALLHDLGKASSAFQARLEKPSGGSSLYRHEWVSLRLFFAFVGDDDDEGWLKRLAAPAAENEAWQRPEHFFRDGADEKTRRPFSAAFLARTPLAAAIGWLIVSHHRLPVLPVHENGGQAWLGKRSPVLGQSRQLKSLLEQVAHAWNAQERDASKGEDIAAYWRFEHGLPTVAPLWRKEAAKVAGRLMALRAKRENWLADPYVMHLARLALMLADHCYSALPPGSPERVGGGGNKRGPLFANTAKEDGKIRHNQALDEHLVGVARNAAGIARALPGITRNLPRLARHRGLARRTAEKGFTWQNKAADAAMALRECGNEHGAFIVNMASTGCGKTLANARILYALADPRQGMRATFALGLRALTLQTGQSYRDHLRLDDDELAIRVGGAASRDLFDFYRRRAEADGSESRQALIEESDHVLFEGQTSVDGPLAKMTRDENIRRLLFAPLLVCTIDHLTPATEARRGGRQIAPMLRLMSGDLVLDELDDFALEDLPALTRLVHWAGLLGTRVLISSATLPPALVEGLYLAYRAGRRHFSRNRGPGGGVDRGEPEIACLWVDEFDAQALSVTERETFVEKHAAFARERARALLEKTTPCRRGELVPLAITAKDEDGIRREFAGTVREAMLRAHARHHETCPRSGKTVSFGLVRMANVEPLFDVALELFRLGAPAGARIHLCVYHSRFPLLLRSAIERRLDGALNRRDPQAVYDLPEIRAALDRSPEKNQLFVVLGSPVTEVGRDHDYDWAVVEPSSMRSLIQLAGRVRRHRQIPCPEDKPNILILEFNLRHFRAERGADGKRLAAFVRPGFESKAKEANAPFRLTHHNLARLLREDEYKVISAKPRILPRAEEARQPRQNLADLEHARLAEAMLPGSKELNAACCWENPQAALTWVLPQQQPFRDDSGEREVELLFLPKDGDEPILDDDKPILHRVEPGKGGKQDIYTEYESYLRDVPLEMLSGPRIAPWGKNDLPALLQEQAEARGESLYDCARRFTTVEVPENATGWRYHPALGFAKLKPSANRAE
ncbi:MAG: type I-F CRISPR-associated helicase Cas3f [Candidatus Accumulibacter sp.]|jgi:CRISPR-associated endonuclease/helicase Cas3|nr:type I-F CRISPR-associated helicase Cas3f [Accumulibacter sp.]